MKKMILILTFICLWLIPYATIANDYEDIITRLYLRSSKYVNFTPFRVVGASGGFEPFRVVDTISGFSQYYVSK